LCRSILSSPGEDLVASVDRVKQDSSKGPATGFHTHDHDRLTCNYLVVSRAASSLRHRNPQCFRATLDSGTYGSRNLVCEVPIHDACRRDARLNPELAHAGWLPAAELPCARCVRSELHFITKLLALPRPWHASAYAESASNQDRRALHDCIRAGTTD
jgi:hypothetical protein